MRHLQKRCTSRALRPNVQATKVCSRGIQKSGLRIRADIFDVFARHKSALVSRRCAVRLSRPRHVSLVSLPRSFVGRVSVGVPERCPSSTQHLFRLCRTAFVWYASGTTARGNKVPCKLHVILRSTVYLVGTTAVGEVGKREQQLKFKVCPATNSARFPADHIALLGWVSMGCT